MNNKGRSKSKKSNAEYQQSQTLKLESELKILTERLQKETPPSGFYYKKDISKESLTEAQDEIWRKPKIYFKELPISQKTQRALNESKFTKMTPIQRIVLPHAIAGRDIIGASKTGSGKTLCYIIPVLEILFRERWTKLDGLGALIIVPTRELAIQVFEVFKQVGKYMDLSGGLVIGGHNVDEERGNIFKMNILIGTPGRLLHHLSETEYFNSDNLKVLVIDEADRILDDGFQDNLNEILEYLPKNRVSLLFSATLTNSLKSLIKMNMKNPEYIVIHNIETIFNTDNENKELELAQGKTESNLFTPINLTQYYSIIESHEKVDTLYSFLNSHPNSKCIVFLSSCKQVRFFYEIFKRLKLKFSFYELHGKQKQQKRTYIFYNFANKKNTVLFATDIASRGIDFPAVDWVIQLDCPEDIPTYIHRVGRTARYKATGSSLLFISKGESKFVDELENKKMIVKKIRINPGKIISLKPILRSILSEDPLILHLAQKAISSYVKSIYLLNKKEVFSIDNINLEELSLSYGLMMTPEMKIIKKSQNELKNEKKNENRDIINGERDGPVKKLTKLQKLKEKIKQKKLLKKENANQNEGEGENKVEEEDDFLKVKRKNSDNLEDLIEEEQETETKVDKIKFPVVEDKSSEFINKISKKIESNKEESKIIQKQRIFDKHQYDRMRSKAFDYEKHGISLEEKIKNKEENKQKKESFDKNEKKVKIDLEKSTLEDKSKMALELIKGKGLLK